MNKVPDCCLTLFINILIKTIELFSSNEERDNLENLADLYSIFTACEVLEKAFVRDSVSAEEYQLNNFYYS